MEYSSGNEANSLMPVTDNKDKQPSKGNSIMLPPELLSMMCGFLSKQVLKQVRQVSKTWERAAVPYLFDEIFMSLNMADLRIAKLVVRQFKQYLRTLVFSSVYILDVDRESFVDAFEEEYGIDRDSFDGDSEEEFGTNADNDIGHSDHAFKLYRIARKNQRESSRTGLPSAYLSFALASSPRIQKIVLTDSPSSRSISRQSLQAFEPRRSKNCPIMGCVLEDTEHFPSEVRQSGFSCYGSANQWRLILQALSVTNSSVSELSMVPEDRETPMNTSAFSMSPGELSQAKLCFHALTKLCLNCAWDPERFSKRHIHPNVTKLLGCAVNLESLALVTHEEHDLGTFDNCPLQAVLGGCTFPKLKSLILGFSEFTEVELLRLLTHSRDLRQLTIDCPILKEGSWGGIVDWARASLPYLKHVQLNQLYGGFEDPWADTEYMDVYGHVREFFFAQGENPFTTKALTKYHADRDIGRTKVAVAGGESWMDICDRYH